MKNLTLRFTLILCPLYLIIVLFVAGYTFLYWLLLICFRIAEVKEEIFQYAVPMLLPILPLIIWFRPRVRKLRFKEKARSAISVFLGMATIFTGFTTFAAVSFIVAWCGKLTPLHHISELPQKPFSKYYTLSSFFIDKAHITSCLETRHEGKSRKWTSYDVYITAPLYDKESDTKTIACGFFLSQKYSTRIITGVTASEQNSQMNYFLHKCYDNFNNDSTSQFTFLERTGKNDTREEFENAVSKSPVIKTQNPVILEPWYKPFSQRATLNRSLLLIFFAAGISLLTLLLTFSGTLPETGRVPAIHRETAEKQ